MSTKQGNNVQAKSKENEDEKRHASTIELKEGDMLYINHQRTSAKKKLLLFNRVIEV